MSDTTGFSRNVPHNITANTNTAHRPIAEFISQVPAEKRATEDIVKDVIEFRSAYQTLYYSFDHGIPPQ